MGTQAPKPKYSKELLQSKLSVNPPVQPSSKTPSDLARLIDMAFEKNRAELAVSESIDRKSPSSPPTNSSVLTDNNSQCLNSMAPGQRRPSGSRYHRYHATPQSSLSESSTSQQKQTQSKLTFARSSQPSGLAAFTPLDCGQTQRLDPTPPKSTSAKTQTKTFSKWPGSLVCCEFFACHNSSGCCNFLVCNNFSACCDSPG